MVQGDSPLSRPTKDNQYSSWGALSVVSPVFGIRGLLGSRHQGSGHAFSRGAHPKWTPHWAAPGGPPSPRLSVVRSTSVRGHQAPPPEQKADPPPAGAPSRRSSLHPPFRVGPHSRPAPGAAHRSIWGRGEPRGSRPAPGRTSPPEAAPGAAAALKPLRSRRPLTCNAPTREAPRHSAPRPRPPAGPRPPLSPEQPQSLGGPLQGGKTAPPRSPRPHQSSHSALDTGPPASARPGTDLKSAPPEPIR
ncbi:hypothetical protein NDU88_004658 [Pleurodeles waltl]|uniref:Basic proline-rich protein-like n=1 Tax=Pleurodeles waltl TaxID=8319 RepID=A0AAV7SJD8_PLEWA|nr:hypothetical protein NDU88_004658 [Pleurodeles waltl]